MIMRRYRTAPSAGWAQGVFNDELPKSLQVFEPDQQPKFTGILDASGNKIFVEVTREPIGFVWPRNPTI